MSYPWPVLEKIASDPLSLLPWSQVGRKCPYLHRTLWKHRTHLERSGRYFESADAYWNLPAVVLKLWPASESSGELVKDLDVQGPPQTFWIRISRGGAWTFVSLTSSPGDSEVHQSLGITGVGVTQMKVVGSRAGRGGSKNRSLESLEKTQSRTIPCSVLVSL